MLTGATRLEAGEMAIGDRGQPPGSLAAPARPDVASMLDGTGSAGPAEPPEWLVPTKLAVPALSISRRRPARERHGESSPLFDVRSRLIPQLEAALTRPLTVIAAPAGFGKTTLLAAWRSTPDGARHPLAWVSLDATDNDPARFWGYVVAALRTVRPDVGTATQAALRTPGALPEAIASAVVRDLAGQRTDLVLVLDDYELIEAAPIHRGLAYLVEHAPPGLHLVVLSRTTPPLPLARLRARGQLAEIGANLLRFDVDETTTFFAERLGRALPDDLIGALVDATEGWAAGLQLAALALDGQADPTAILARFSGGHRYVLDYMVEEVLDQQPKPVQEFLLQTSILGRLTGDLGDAVTGGEHGQAMLEQLERANLFLVPLDADRRWYRYHLLFGEALRHRLHTLDPSAARVLHGRAAAWFERNGFASEAIEQSLLGCDWSETMRRLTMVVGDVLERGEWATLERWLTAIPESSLVTNVELCLSRAWSLLIGGRLDAAERLGLLASARAEEIGDNYNLGFADAFQAHLAATRGDGAATIEHARRALTRLPPTAHVRRAAAYLQAGFGHLLLGELNEAASSLETVISVIFPADASHFVEYRALSHLGYARQLQGNLIEAERHYRDILRRCDDTRPNDRTRALIRLGNLERERNDLDEAADLVGQAISLDERHGGRYLREAYVVLARVQSARGQLTEAFQAFEQAERAADHVSHRPSGRRARAHVARLHLTSGDLQAAAWWAAASGIEARLDGPEVLGFEHEVETLTLVRVWMSQGRSDDALRVLGRFRQLAERTGRVASTVEMLILEALARAARGEDDTARACLTDALALAEPSGYVRLFADEGMPLARLLEGLVADQRRGGLDGSSPSPWYLRRVLAAFAGDPGAPRAGGSGAASSFPSLPEPLTSRELELLRLMATGASNQQIADRLVVGMPTVKTHVNRIFRKLDAASRIEAVTRARDLGLLDRA